MWIWINVNYGKLIEFGFSNILKMIFFCCWPFSDPKISLYVHITLISQLLTLLRGTCRLAWYKLENVLLVLEQVYFPDFLLTLATFSVLGMIFWCIMLLLIQDQYSQKVKIFLIQWKYPSSKNIFSFYEEPLKAVYYWEKKNMAK